MTPALRSRWHQLVAPLLPDYSRREAELTRLATAYEAPSRHYHNLQHLENLLHKVAGFPMQDAVVVELAIWFHDAVYQALSADNEAKSAEWALAFLQETNLEPARRERVADLIRRTADHTQPQPPGDADLLLFLDADLSILGAPEAAYWAYAHQVRREYRLVPDLLYRPGRRKVLAKMLAAPVLFHTPALHAALDAPARRNLQAELAAWEQGGLPPA
ncbi:phosphohydrolase [Hymenobacter sp. HMF4947]|uniref:Phosphohydrolase n=1 Tax=Hymenobacter ginkgonis TaxID=2682976 RepID=A0A7K1TAM8_9BACT|nr:phosphohydrolase [Hymenobacter ginkgonis]MVN75362.1 phosphohydrolase [Hymenobacter ginkgonis]